MSPGFGDLFAFFGLRLGIEGPTRYDSQAFCSIGEAELQGRPMDLKTWLRKQTVDASKMGRLIQIGRDIDGAETFFQLVIEGIDGDFQGEYIPLAEILIGRFKAQGGRLERPSRFRHIPLLPGHSAIILEFDTSLRRPRETTWEQSWTEFYATLLGINLSEQPADLGAARSNKRAEIVDLRSIRGRDERLKA